MTEVDICSLALTELGVEPITSFFDGTQNAKLCSRHYPTVRDAALRDHPWNFAIDDALLTELPTVPLMDWAHGYALPNDPWCLRVLHMAARRTKFKVQKRSLLTDATEARIKFIFRETNPTNFDSLFVDALIFLLASRLAVPIKSDAAVAQKMYDFYLERVARARTADGMEGTPEPIQSADTLIKVR